VILGGDPHIPTRRHRVIRRGHSPGRQRCLDLRHQGPQLCLGGWVFFEQVDQPSGPSLGERAAGRFQLRVPGSGEPDAGFIQPLPAQRTSLWGLMNVTTRRWLARASFALLFAAVVLALAVAGWRSSVTLIMFAAIGVCTVLAGGYWFLANRGLLRWLALVLVIAAPVLIVAAFAWHHLVWVAVVAVALMAAAAGAARAALSTDGQDAAMPAVPAARPRRPFVIMNPRSGGGKVTRFGLQEKAEKLGAEVALLEGPGTVDVAALARQAVADGADLLGVAGGDGTQALVAGIAAEHGLPFLVISAGTRNHFALDLGLDREDPATCLDGLTDGEELRVDLGIIGGRTFVNNASFGAYAEVGTAARSGTRRWRTCRRCRPGRCPRSRPP
jgi:hypothetical protein